MGRRRRNRDLVIAEAIFSFGALVFFLSLFSPGVRQAISTIGAILLVLIGLGLIVGVGFVIHRFIARRRRLEEEAMPLRVFDLDRMEPEVIVPATPAVTQIKVEVPAIPSREVKLAALLEQLRTIDWFQFEKIVALMYRKLGYT